MREGSRIHKLSMLEVGETYWEDCNQLDPGVLQSALNPVGARRPEFMKDWVLKTSVWTAVGSKAGEVRVLVCCERLE
jgi:hypothetical protein